MPTVCSEDAPNNYFKMLMASYVQCLNYESRANDSVDLGLACQIKERLVNDVRNTTVFTLRLPGIILGVVERATDMQY